MKLDAESYLQSGSNELRVLEYTSCGHSFGINILKVQKIISHPQCLTSGINTHPSVIGIFKDNNIVIPLVDLGHFLGFGKAESLDNKKVVVTEFFNVLNAFLVDSVEWIHHFVWEDVINANDVMKTINQKYVISIVKPDGQRMVPLLDYETMILDLCPELGYKEMEKISKQEFDGRGYRILIAEDSPSVRNMLVAELMELGFEVVSAWDGQEACDILEKDKNFSLVISDVEMPQMDGLALTTAIRTNPEIEDMPVIVYSSIGDIGMKTRAEFLKASAHVTKLSIEELMANVIKLVSGGKAEIPDNKTVPVGKAAPIVSAENGPCCVYEDSANSKAKLRNSSITDRPVDAALNTASESLSAVTAVTAADKPAKQGTADKDRYAGDETADLIAEMPEEHPVSSESTESANYPQRSPEGKSMRTALNEEPEMIPEAGRVTDVSAESAFIVEANKVAVEHTCDLPGSRAAGQSVKKKRKSPTPKSIQKRKVRLGNPALQDWPIGRI